MSKCSIDTTRKKLFLVVIIFIVLSTLINEYDVSVTTLWSTVGGEKICQRIVNVKSEDHQVDKEALSTDEDMTETQLVATLKRKLAAVPKERMRPYEGNTTCGPEEIKVNGCGAVKNCTYRTRLPFDVENRIHQLLANPDLQISLKHQEAIDYMGRRMKKRHELLVLTAVSSNHFKESQAMLYLMHKNLRTTGINYGIIVYDLGLNDQERQTAETYCNCTVLRFPFSEFPNHMRTLSCYAWKPLIVKAHVRQARFIFWADASVRLNKPDLLMESLKRVEERGLQQLSASNPGPSTVTHTLPEMYHSFGDEPCAYQPYGMLHATAGIYHNEPFIRQALLLPWVGCALAKQCICPISPATVLHCNPQNKARYAVCHRFDQSALSIILSRLYQNAVLETSGGYHGGYTIMRGDHLPYFDNLRLNKTTTI